jgi:hypothetical protein
MLLPFTKLALAVEDQNYNPEAAMWQFAYSPGKHMFLIVKQSKFEVVYGMWRCTPIHQLGERIAWLMGDRCMIAGSTVHPGCSSRPWVETLSLTCLRRWKSVPQVSKTSVLLPKPSLENLCMTKTRPRQ